MKIKKISSNAKQWFNLESPVTIMTPGGSQSVERFFFNGFEQHYDVEFQNSSGEVYRAQSTGNHKYQLLNGDWVETENLERGMECHAGWKVKSVVLGQGVLATMDVEVPVEHCYLLANGVVSHNTALLMGGVSEGISPDPAMTYTQTSAAGEVDRIVVPLLNLMKERGVYTDEVINDLVDKQGSVQHVTWLSDEEKAVFKTAFEINQKTVLRMAAARAKYIDQWQSLNLFFAADEDPAWISECHKTAFHDPDILGLYYIYTQAGVQASKGECEACQ